MVQTVKELHEKRIKMWDESMKNHIKYINSQTNLFDEKYVQERDCPVCGTDDDMPLFHKAGGTYVKCQKCSMVYLNPAFKDDALTHYYQNNHTVQAEVVESDTDDFYLNIYNQGLDSIVKTTHNLKNILDIGCSSGTFLDVAKKRDLTTFGVELNQVEFQFAKVKGHQVYNDLLENIAFEERFDAITMWDVFEHIKDGEFYLNLMKNLLSEEGVIFLQIPSSDSLAAKILQDKCNMFDGLEHVNLYGVETVKLLAQKCGLEIKSMQTVISEIGVINNYLNYDDPYLGATNNKISMANLIDEEQIHKTLQGYKLQLVLGKKS